MLEKTTRLVSENLARTMQRRTFLRHSAETVFVGLAALASGNALAGRADARESGPRPPGPPQCAPPGPYCNLNGVNEPNGCHGGSCFQHMSNGQLLQCRFLYIYQAGCWTTAATGGGYWTCCDCTCGTAGSVNCGCAQYSGSPT